MYEEYVLGHLLYGPKTGYTIKQAAEKTLGNFISIGYSSIYPALKANLKHGYITVTEDNTTGRLQKIYEITPRGRGAFLKWLRTPIDLSYGQHRELLKVYFFSFLPRGERTQLLVAYKKQVQKEIDRIQALKEQEGNNLDYYHNATLNYGLQYYQMVLDWAQEVQSADLWMR